MDELIKNAFETTVDLELLTGIKPTIAELKEYYFRVGFLKGIAVGKRMSNENDIK